MKGNILSLSVFLIVEKEQFVNVVGPGYRGGVGKGRG
jgi:hypothetical protein